MKGGITTGIGEKLRNLRLNSKRTLEEQSILLGVSLNSVYRWEHDLASPKKPVLDKVIDLYGVPLNWLLSDGGTGGGQAPAAGQGQAQHSANPPHSDDSTEAQLLKIFKKLSEQDKYKVLGYVERICVENMDKNYSHSFI